LSNNATLNKVNSVPVPPRNVHVASKSPSRVDPESRFLVAVTGASGVLYARRLIEILGPRTDVILTKDAAPVIEIETGLSTKEFVELRVESFQIDVREATGPDPANDRDAMDEGHVVRLPEESNHIREGGLGDDLIEAVVEDDATLPFAGHRQDGAERGIEVPRMDGTGDPAGDLDDWGLLDAEL